MLNEGDASGIPVRVAIVDASPLFARGAREGLSAHPQVVVTAVAHTLDGARPLTDVDVCMWDTGLDDDGWTGLGRLVDQGVAILAVVRDGRPIDLSALLRAGASGVVDRDVTEDALLAAVIAAAQGRTMLAAGSTGALWEQAASGARGTLPALTRRERQVLQLMGRGLSNRAIADELFISENTVKNHVRSLHEKLQVHSRTEAVVRAAQDGIVEIVPRGPV